MSDASTGKTVPQRNGQIELLRLVFSVMVAGFHLGCSLQFDYELFAKGYLAVEFFFMVSGFLLAKSLSKYQVDQSKEVISTSLRFMGRKYASFYRYYGVAIVMTCAAWIPVMHLTVGQWLAKVLESVPTFLLIQTAGFRYANWFVPTWYVSAMLIAMFILTPVLLKWGRVYSLYVAPLVSLLLLGIIWRNNGGFGVSAEWQGPLLNLGLMRALAEISLGCLFFYIVRSGILKRFPTIILHAVKLLCYALPLYYMTVGMAKSMEPAMVIFLAIAVLLTFQDDKPWRFFNNRFVYWLGKLSLPVYLCHSIARYYVVAYCPSDWGYYPQLGVFFGVTLVLSVVCMLIGDGLHYLVKRKKTAA